MKKIVLFLISVYKLIVSPLLHAVTGTNSACRYPVTCSSYAIQAVEKYGAFRGSILALRRLASCHPFAKPTLHQV